MPNKRQLLQELKGEKVTIYTVEKEFTGRLIKLGNDFIVSRTTSHSIDKVIIKPNDIADVKMISILPVIFVYNHFNF